MRPIVLDASILYGQSGNFKQAAIEFEKVIELEPENEEAKQKLEQLKNQQKIKR